MSDTSQIAVERFRQEAPHLEAVCRQIERHVEEDRAPLLIRFAELFFSKAPPEFLEERSVDALAHMAIGAFHFLEESDPERVDVQVFNPDVDNEGWFAPVTVVRTNISERPFVVDSVREFLSAQDLVIEHYIYPVLSVERDEAGRIVDLAPSRESGDAESLVHCEVARLSDEETRGFIRQEVEQRLHDVVRVTADFEPMLGAVDSTVEALEAQGESTPRLAEEIEEVRSFLRWLRDGGFVFLGYRSYDVVETDGERAVQVKPGSGLGILRNEGDSMFAEPVPLDELPDAMRQLLLQGPLVIISKTNATATVHRRARMDYVGVKKLDQDGNPVGEHRFLGLFTSQAYSEKAEQIPILRRKLRRIVDDAGVQEGSHDYKEIHRIFNSMPKEELFLTSAEEVAEDVRTVLTTHQLQDVRVTLRRDPLQRGLSVMVIMPKERFSGEVRQRIEAALVEELEGEVLNYHLALGEGDQARLHFYMGVPQSQIRSAASDELEDRLRPLIRSWTDRVQVGLERIRPPDEARRLARHYGEGFSAEYQAATAPDLAVRDILQFEAMRDEGWSVAIDFTQSDVTLPLAGEERVTELKVYLRGERLILSDFMPILENAGLRVIAVNPFELRDAGALKGIVYSFMVQDAAGRPLDVEGVGSLLADTILAVRQGDAASDRLNGLVVSAGLAWREVAVLRTYAAYAFQLGAVPSRMALPSALEKHPEIGRLLLRLFEIRFDPDRYADFDARKEASEQLLEEFQSALREVNLLSDDRALRRLGVLIQATVRTNYYQGGGSVPTRRSGGVPYLSLKFDTRELASVARSRLRYEVWVRSARMEGVHMRGARVARGGIRYSDRPDDFRSEVQGLVKTQMVKNAVIVPAGSKGGFITLRSLPDREAMYEESREQYKTLVRGLLDITDNVRRGEPVPPEGVVAWDEPDPYLVVAADKGTAKFSDVANQVAEEDYDFWLGDAFASGGEHGYDHKEVGITARGAWECVKRHFVEKGKDIQSEPFTVVGIGDMSGDVFGNGMLLSRQIRLVGAFDHRDIFIDPNPDPKSSYEERQRLFKQPRSSWQDYDRDRLSEGGMIVPRGSKAVELTPQAREALGIPEDVGELAGEALIRWILSAPVELLWNGGIGTYVKGVSQSQAEVGDPANDDVRVDSSDLRCEVVGEGGNLGMTQEARIEYALSGGRLNVDAIDNSGGVDLSDREVNLKILLRSIVQDGVISMERRNELLRELAEPVTDLVLGDNRSQSLAISLDQVRARESLDDFRDLMYGLEQEGLLDRADEKLPSWETLMDRVERGQGLTRPELAVLLSYAKLHVKTHVLAGDLPDHEALERYLLDYFPEAVRELAGEERLQEHRLRREIVTSQLVNDLVDLMGAGFLHRVSRDTGKKPEEVTRAWVIAARLADYRTVLRTLRIREARGLSHRVTYRWIMGLARVLDRTTRWVLANVDQGSDPSTTIERNLPELERLRSQFGELVVGEDREIFDTLVEELAQAGAKQEFARHLIALRFLDQLLEILQVSRQADVDPVDAARAFYRVSEMVHVAWLRRAIFQTAKDNQWDQREAQGLNDDLTAAHQRITAAVMRLRARTGSVDEAVDHLMGEGSQPIKEFRVLLEEIRGDEPLSLSAVAVTTRELLGLAQALESLAASHETGDAESEKALD